MSYSAPFPSHKITNRGFGCLPSSYIGNEVREKFERAANDFPFAAELLEISTMWGGYSLPLMMYDRASAPRKRWSDQGEVEDVSLDEGMGFQRDKTYNAIEYLERANLISLVCEDEYKKLNVDKVLQKCLIEQARDLDQLRKRSLMLMCHVFPGNKEIEPMYVMLSIHLCTTH